MSGIWDRVQSILDKLEEERGRQDGLEASIMDYRPERDNPNWPNEPHGSVNDPKNWDPASAQGLHQARTDLATMYGGPNPIMETKMPPDPNNPIQKQQWELAMTAANASMNNQLDPRLRRMWMRQEGNGDQTYGPWVREGYSPLQPMGPFVNTIPATPQQIKDGIGIGKGSRAYIDFYGRR